MNWISRIGSFQIIFAGYDFHEINLNLRNFIPAKINLQSSELPGEAFTHYVTWPFVHVTNVSHVTKLKNYISTFTRFMTTKLGRVLTSGRKFGTQTPKSPTSNYYCTQMTSNLFTNTTVRQSFSIRKRQRSC